MKRVIDTRTTVLLVIGFAIIVAISTKVMTLALASMISLACLAFSPAGQAKISGRLIRLNLVLALFWMILPLHASDTSWCGLAWDAGRVGLPLLITLRANAIIILTTALLEPLGLMGILEGLRGLHVSDRLTQVLAISVRYFALLRQEYDRMRIAMLARGYKLSATRRGYSALAFALGMLLVRSFDRSDRVGRAIASRSFGRPAPVAKKPEPRNVGIALASTMVISLLVFVEFSSR